ncbi:helix-turn-helix domain-containing protein [Segatella paludivivens]|nr:helix-turn-helix domain-containing protein [Segatella paludivivens]
MMGKNATVVSEWLSGDRNFTIDTLTDISVELGISLIDTDCIIKTCNHL